MKTIAIFFHKGLPNHSTSKMKYLKVTIIVNTNLLQFEFGFETLDTPITLEFHGRVPEALILRKTEKLGFDL